MDCLKEPRRKRNVFVRREQPFPVVIESVSGIPVNEHLWQTYTGRFNGDCVIMDKQSDMHALYKKGYFGKASLSKNFPTFGKFRNGIPPFISERQWKQRIKWKEARDARRSQNTTNTPVKLEQNESHNFHEVMNIDTCSSSPGVTDFGHSLPREAGPQAFPPDWEDRQKDVDTAPAVNTSYRTPTIKFRREPRKKPCASAPDSSDSGRTGMVSSSSGNTHETSDKDSPTVDAHPANGSRNLLSVQVHSNVNIKCETESEREGSSQDEMRQCVLGMGNRVNSSNLRAKRRLRVRHAAPDDVVVLRDSDSEDEELQIEKLEARLMKNPFPLLEKLHLTLEEAFFLSYALGCLQVMDLSGKQMTLKELWETFKKSNDNFVQKYVAYHHFRSKGWVVKPGIKYGGDFLLYKEGPPFYHASYIVMVEVLTEDDWCRSPSHNRRSLTWPLLFGANRLAETVGKEILMCRVIWPASVTESGPHTPQQLARFCVEEVLLKRWVSSQEREELDTEDIID